MAGIRVWRGAASNSSSREVPISAAGIVAGLPVTGTPRDLERGVSVQFFVGASGKRSHFCAWISPTYFGHLAKLMLKVSPDAAETAFLSAMLEARKSNA